MKKTIILLSAAVIFAGCQKSQTTSEGYTLEASIEQQSGGTTKTYLDNKIVKWSAGDQILLYTDNATPEGLTMTLQGGAGTAVGRFYTDATPAGNPDCAIYPASAFQSYDGTNKTFTFTLPATQNYVKNSFDNGANVAVAKVNGKTMDFLNTCGVLKLQLKGTMCVSKIELTSNNPDEYLYGTFEANAYSDEPSATHVGDTGGKTLTLNCDNVALSVANAISFYFVVPVGSFGTTIAENKGFTVTVYDVLGAPHTITFIASPENPEEVIINRSKVRAMPENKAYRKIPSGYTALQYIESTGAQIIDTQIPASLNNFYSVDFEFTELPTEEEKDGGSVIGSGYKFGANRVSLYYFDRPYIYMQLNANNPSNLYVFCCPEPVYLSHIYHIVTKNGCIEVDNIQHSFTPISEYESLSNVTLFASPRAGDVQKYDSYSCIKLYYANVNNDNNTIGAFLPAMRTSDSVIGMYDLISDTFLTNDGTEYFIAGPELTD